MRIVTGISLVLVMMLLIMPSGYAGQLETTPVNGLAYGIGSSVVIGTDLYVGAYHHGVFRSSDNGASWYLLENQMRNHDVIALTYMYPVLYAGVPEGGGLYISSNNGTDWTQSNAGLNVWGVLSLANNGYFVFAGCNGNGVYRSSDNGAHWSAANASISDKAIKAVVTSGSILFAGSGSDGVYRSVNNGDSWTPVNAGLTDHNVNALLVNGSSLFAGTASGVFQSTDNGDHWVQRTTYWTISLAANGADIYAGLGWHGGIRHSSDYGTNWNPENSGLGNNDVNTLFSSNTSVFAGTNSGVYSATPTSTLWQPAFFGLVDPVTSICTGPSNTMYAATMGSGVFVSSDGMNWSGTGIPDKYVYSVTYDNGYLVAGCEDNIFYSSNGGSSWTGSTSGLGEIGPIAGNGSTLFASGGDLYQSIDHGATWLSVTTPVWTSTIAFHGSDLFIGSDGDGVWRSSNNGATWNDANGDLPDNGVKTLMFIGNTLIAGTEGNVYASTDNGAHWHQCDVGGPGTGSNALAYGASNLYAAGSEKVSAISYNSTVSGGWMQAYQWYIPGNWVTSLLAGSDHYLYMGTDNSGWLDAPNQGILRMSECEYSCQWTKWHVNPRWNLVSMPFNESVSGDFLSRALGQFFFYYVPSIGYFPSYNGFFMGVGRGYWAKYTAADSGWMLGTPIGNDTIEVREGWNLIGAASVPVAITDIAALTPGMIAGNLFAYQTAYVGVTDSLRPGLGYWVKINHDGQLIIPAGNWPWGKNAPKTYPLRIVPDGELPPPPPGEIASAGENMPQSFNLEQNYPNPFNPVTVIHYALPSDAKVRLAIYDVLGQVVATLADGVQTAGYKELGWDAAGAASGIYFYRLEASATGDPAKTFTQVKKMLLVK